MDEFGIKELYDIAIKTTRPIQFCGRTYEEGEPLVFLERAQFGVVNENRIRVFARGGKENRRLIMWETTQPIQMQIQQGVISKENLSALTNNFLVEEVNQSIPFHKRIAPQLTDSNDEFIELELPHKPNTLTKLFLYDDKNNKISKEDYFINEEYTKLLVKNEEQYREIAEFVVDSYFDETGHVLSIGKDALRGYFRLEARTRVKDDIDGIEKTGIFVIPKMRIMSDLSIRLGDSINPFVYGFTFEGEPVGGYGESHVCDLVFLNEDLDAESLV